MVMEYHGCVESMSTDLSNFNIKKDGDGETLSVDKVVVTNSANAGIEYEIGSRVAFTMSDDGSEVLSLRKCD